MASQVPAEAVELWWPNGQGEQVLYDVNIDVLLPQTEAIIDQVSRGKGDHWTP